MPLTLVGDVDQCVLEGQSILTGDGNIPVENICVGHMVLSATGKSGYGEYVVTGKSRREGEFVITTIETALGFKMKVTHNHQCFASIPNRSVHTRYNPDMHWVYVMYRGGFGYRVGVTKNPKNRLRGEHADKMWLVKSCDTRAEAQYWEHVYASVYGLPRLTFVDHNPTHDGSYMDDEWIGRFFSAVDTELAAQQFQDGEGFRFDTGAHIIGAGNNPRVVLYTTICAPRNTKNPTHELRIETSSADVIKYVQDIGVNLRPAKKGMRHVYRTMDMRDIQLRASAIHAATNCEVVVRACFVSGENMGGRDISPHMMPAGNIIPGFLVPVFRNGQVVLDEVVSVTKEKGRAVVHDIEVDRVANFFVNGICTHNTLFRFTGANPDIMTNEAYKFFPDMLRLKLETNYRSSHAIVNAQRKSIAFNYSEHNGPYDQSLFKNLVARGDAEDGVPISFAMYITQEEEAEAVAQEIVNLVDSGEFEYGDFFVGSRTRSQLAYIEGALTRVGVGYVNLAGGCFWQAKHVQDVLSYVKLAHNERDDDAFKRVYNIASKWFVAPFGSNKGQYVNHRYLGRAFIESVNGSYVSTRRVEWRYRAGVEDLRNFVYDVQGALSQGVAAAIQYVIDHCYKQWLASDEGLLSIDESENGKLDDLLTVFHIASKFETPEAFFDYVAAMEKAAEEAKNGDHSKYVVISTIHRLKGKERPVVFGIGVCEGETAGPQKKPAGLLPHTFSLTDPPNFGVLPTGGRGRIEDERCAFFVLVSRAQERVYLSGFTIFRNATFWPSRFVAELGLLENDEQP